MATSIADMEVVRVVNNEGGVNFSEEEKFGDLGGRDIRHLYSGRPIIIYTNSESKPDQPSRIGACFKAIFSTTAFFLLAGTITGACVAGPVGAAGGFGIGGAIAATLVPIILIVHIAKAILGL